MRQVLLFSCLVGFACSPPPATGDAGSDAGVDAGFDAGPEYPPLTGDEETLLTNRPYRLVVPAGYDAGTRVPLVMLLHGYSASGLVQDQYFLMSELAQARTFILATPDGLKSSTGERYWNATDGCCDLEMTKNDDVAYLTAVMNEVRLKYRIDDKRVFFVGHSNGGFMSHRMACDRAGRIAGIVSLAGAQWKDVGRCVPDAGAPAVLQVHGDLDSVIYYAGTLYYPGAVETVRDWAQLKGCDAGTLQDGGAPVDSETNLTGAETKKQVFGSCSELWTIQGGSHIPALNATWAPAIYDWLMARPKP